MKLAKSETIKHIDETVSSKYHISKAVLMENAGRTVAMYISEIIKGKNSKVCIVCGKGNNGGDGFVAARHLSLNGYDVDVVLIGSQNEVKGEALDNLLALRSTKAKLLELSQDTLNSELCKLENILCRSDLIVDAMLGTGFKGELKEELSCIVRLINRVKADMGERIRVMSVDIPTGLEADTGRVANDCIIADITMTFAMVKRGMVISPGSAMCGQIILDHIGIPQEAMAGHSDLEHFSDPDYIRSICPKRSLDGHKGTFGKVLTMAGSAGMMGGAALCSMAVLRSGAGLSYLATCNDGCRGIDALVPEVVKILIPIDKTGRICKNNVFKTLLDRLEEFDSVAIGPGLGVGDEVKFCVKSLLDRSNVPVVLDADGVNAFDGNLVDLKSLARQDMVITPHPGEFSRLFCVNINDVNLSRTDWARKAAAEIGCVVVLKGSRTVVAHPCGKAYINSTGNDGMATAGSGDVLSGVIASFMAQGVDAFNSAVLGVFVHGLAGDLAASNKGRSGMVARDIVDFLPYAVKLIESDPTALNTIFSVKRFGR